MEDFQSTTIHCTCPWSSQEVSAMAGIEVNQASIWLADALFEKPNDLLRPRCDLFYAAGIGPICTTPDRETFNKELVTVNEV